MRPELGFVLTALVALALSHGTPVASMTAEGGDPDPAPPVAECKTSNTVIARVAAIEQVYVYNRFGSFNPAGMMFALRRDVVVAGGDETAEIAGPDGTPLEDGERIPLVPTADTDSALAGHVRLRSDKRPRPIVLRVNRGDCLRVEFTNLLSPVVDEENEVVRLGPGRTVPWSSDEPATRAASMHVNGLALSGDIGSDGSNVGSNASSLAAPGETRTYTWRASVEGGFLLYSLGAPAGGEGDGGQLGLGLFGSVNVEPKGSHWFRSQVTGTELATAATGASALGTPILPLGTDGAGYEAVGADGTPILAMTMPSDHPDAHEEIVHTDLNAVVDMSSADENCEDVDPASTCGDSFREFTVIFHDELTAVQAFPALANEESPLSALRDGMGINYGSAGLGAMVIANREGMGPARDCVECKLEEFFLTSWAMGDPALVLQHDEDARAVEALYPDDPSNVHHSYLGDPVRFRNLHAGPKETHVFHLHAHQWLQDWSDPASVYLDSQTISPGASFTYDVHYGGSGNRNLTPGDSIFHCHLYPHFAQGMWELWRTHDVFEAGTRDRWLPDGEIAGGTPNPAVVPIPGLPLPPMPSPEFRGYPFYIAGVPGHRPPQAPLDINPTVYEDDPAETLMRHIVLGGERETGESLFGQTPDGEDTDLERRYFDTSIPEDRFSVRRTASPAASARRPRARTCSSLRPSSPRRGSAACRSKARPRSGPRWTSIPAPRRGQPRSTPRPTACRNGAIRPARRTAPATIRRRRPNGCSSASTACHRSPARPSPIHVRGATTSAATTTIPRTRSCGRSSGPSGATARPTFSSTCR